MSNPFELLNIKPSLFIDENELTEHYLQAQSTCHPDRFINKSPTEKQAAEQVSAKVNEAYQNLKTPMNRVRCFMEHHNYSINHEELTLTDPALLEETLTWQTIPTEELSQIWGDFCRQLCDSINLKDEAEYLYTKLCFLNRALERSKHAY